MEIRKGSRGEQLTRGSESERCTRGYGRWAEDDDSRRSKGFPFSFPVIVRALPFPPPSLNYFAPFESRQRDHATRQPLYKWDPCALMRPLLYFFFAVELTAVSRFTGFTGSRVNRVDILNYLMWIIGTCLESCMKVKISVSNIDSVNLHFLRRDLPSPPLFTADEIARRTYSALVWKSESLFCNVWVMCTCHMQDIIFYVRLRTGRIEYSTRNKWNSHEYHGWISLFRAIY